MPWKQTKTLVVQKVRAKLITDSSRKFPKVSRTLTINQVQVGLNTRILRPFSKL